ncbi:MAG TPA: DUF1016 family protein [Candidatus Coprovivens excrementavium]|nr:DUF1016 family protein [Candidatus Coprovivens excrementavium]
MNYYNELKKELIKKEISKKARDYANNRNDLNTYYKVGKILTEAGKHYGEGIIKEYSVKLTKDLNQKYSIRTLYNMRLYYEKICCNEKLQPVAAILTWSHYCELLKLKNEDEIIYYINISKNKNLSKRELIQKIKSKEYERLPKETKNKLNKIEELNVKDLIPNPIIIRNNNLDNELNEHIIKELILNNLDNFLSQLGYGFSYIGNEYKIKIGDRYNYIDLLLYNIEYNCYVVIELKVTELKKEHIGQIEVYMNYIDNNLKKVTQNKTIGIIICKKDNHFIMEYCSDRRILSREYLLK